MLKKKSLGGERIHYCQKVTVNFVELYCGYNLLDSIPSLVLGECLFVLNVGLGADGTMARLA